MKSKRHLRTWIEKTLTVITMFLFIFTGSIDDYDMSFMPIYIGLWLITFTNIYILWKYGKGVWLEKESEEESC